MEPHVTDDYVYFSGYNDENRKHIRQLYEKALKGDKEALNDLMGIANDCGYREAYG